MVWSVKKEKANVLSLGPKNKWILATKNRQNIELSEKKRNNKRQFWSSGKSYKFLWRFHCLWLLQRLLKKRLFIVVVSRFILSETSQWKSVFLPELTGLLEPKRLLIMFVPTIGPSFFLLCKKKKLFLWNCWHKIEETYFLPAAGTRLN